MKEKIRKIWVDNQEYCWLVSPFDSKHVCLKIWLSSKKVTWLQIKYRFDNPWIHFGEIIAATPEQIEKYLQLSPVQPRLVAQIIKKVQKNYPTESTNSPQTLNFLFNMNGHIEAIQDTGENEMQEDAPNIVSLNKKKPLTQSEERVMR